MPRRSTTASVIVAIAGTLLLVAPARGDGPTSPRLAALSARVAAREHGAEDTFWKQLTDEGTPMVEDIHDPKGRLLVTFLYRARPDTHVVAMFGAPDGAAAGYARLERLAGTAVFAHSALADPAARIEYTLLPGDDFGPPTGFSDFEKRQPLMRHDALNKHPLRMGSRIDLPKAPPQPLLVAHRETPAGELVEVKVKSKALGNERQVLIYTPPGFAAKGPAYPLVVMFDADAAIANLGIPIVLDELIASRRIPPVVALLVGNADRNKELPGNPAFADLVALDLVPWVRRSYHTTSDPRLTVVAGLSYGGIAASFAAARHPAERMAILDGGAATVAWLARQDAALITEEDVNSMGSALLEIDHAAEAIALFEWNAQRFPTSSNVHDSLADGYWRSGDRARAIAGFQRAVELDPKNEAARQMLDALR